MWNHLSFVRHIVKTTFVMPEIVYNHNQTLMWGFLDFLNLCNLATSVHNYDVYSEG